MLSILFILSIGLAVVGIISTTPFCLIVGLVIASFCAALETIKEVKLYQYDILHAKNKTDDIATNLQYQIEELKSEIKNLQRPVKIHDDDTIYI